MIFSGVTATSCSSEPERKATHLAACLTGVVDRDRHVDEARFRSQRKIAYAFRDELRDLQAAARSRDCGWRKVRDTVDLSKGADGRCGWHGLLTCGSPWVCFVCMRPKCASDAADLNAMVTHHGFDRTLLGSFTVRHEREDTCGGEEPGERLKSFRRKLTECFTKLLQGKGWVKLQKRLGVVALVRAIDITYGESNGFHAHLHPLFLLKSKHSSRRGRDVVKRLSAALFVRWCGIVRRHMGERFVPSEEHGIVLKPCYKADYLVKMGLGLELTAGYAKRGKNGNMSMFQVAERIVAGEEHLRGVWRDYSAGMFRAKQLTWSKEATAILEAALAKTPEKEASELGEPTVLVSFDNEEWRVARRKLRGVNAALLMQAGEDGGKAAVRLSLTNLLGQPPSEKLVRVPATGGDRELMIDCTGGSRPKVDEWWVEEP